MRGFQLECCGVAEKICATDALIDPQQVAEIGNAFAVFMARAWMVLESPV
jgi:hypothetical protein